MPQPTPPVGPPNQPPNPGPLKPLNPPQPVPADDDLAEFRRRHGIL
jgi:hypothetical protein